jgi:FeS assembly SUF system protein
MSQPGKRVPLDLSPPTPDAPAATDAAPPAPPPGEPLTAEQRAALEEQVIAACKTCYDPEVPVNIYELGLVYGIDVTPAGGVHVKMTLTSPACPVAGSLPPDVQKKVRAVPGVTDAKVDVVWDPPWDTDRMSEAAKLQLGID